MPTGTRRVMQGNNHRVGSTCSQLTSCCGCEPVKWQLATPGSSEVAASAVLGAVPEAFIKSVTDVDNISEWSCVALALDPALPHPREVCSIDWAASISAPGSSSVTPALYHLDSGSSCYCTPDREDFATYWTIPPRTIHGIGDSAIYADNMGEVSLSLSEGRTLVHQQNALHLVGLVRISEIGEK
ncbi:hypothetical protein BV25DRAFT_1913979 [Artomyces pyxidatus]|uniref:Uncharacterized protein n=1 Tax=Artomyces pyxidatus TaxID=48021 RepID=A0ACB8T9H3_9AGAM|nr:hypothetical protein BV25DRAFT_1913979 [Artomyces pyxidatus]